MVKYCAKCGIEISDTAVDSIQRFNAIKYCYECAAERKRQQTAECKKRKKRRQQAERILTKEKHYLDDAKEVASIKEQAKAIREQRINLTAGQTEEQRLRTELKRANRHIADLQRQLYQSGADYINLYRKYK